MDKRKQQIVFLIDDDKLCNLVNEHVISSVYDKSLLQTYSDPILAFEKLLDLLQKEPGARILILLDINMPIVDGWGFLDILSKENLPNLGERLKIYMLSSSVDTADKIKAYHNELVSGYLEKPLTARDFEDLFFKRNYA